MMRGLARRIASRARQIVYGKPKKLARSYLARAGTIDLVVHVGAHVGQEIDTYRALGARRIIWIEADPETHARLVERLATAEHGVESPIDHVAVCALISDSEGQTIEFHRYNNDGASSSVYPPAERLRQAWPGLDRTGEIIRLRTRTLQSVLDEVGIGSSSPGTSLLVLDVQGHEAAALRGLGRYAQFFDFCECEISTETIYEGGALYADISTIFEDIGYDLASHDRHNLPWHGDVIFRRRAIR